MKYSCILTSHEKHDHVANAVRSVCEQKYPDWELIIMDSGKLADSGFFSMFNDARIKVYKTGETEDMKRFKAMAPWCYNEAFRRNLVTGDLVSYLCDDDILYPEAFEVFVNWASSNPRMLSMYASIDLAIYIPNKEPIMYGQRKALEIGGRGAYPMDCRVDYLQLCHRRDLLKHFQNNEYWPESLETANHADGVFMEKIGEICHIYPIPVKVGQNRRTQKSTYYPV